MPVSYAKGRGTVMASCWCDRGFVFIPPEWIGTRTGACARPACERLQELRLAGLKHAS